jgi:saccharopine dehydrogenase (NAD+, L-lysine-forming)
MKICVLGGCGDMARVALQLLSIEEEVSMVTVADINLQKAKKISEEFGSKFSAEFVNAKDKSSLIETVKEHDVALGFIGPFYMFEKDIIAACIEAKVNYVSICDDYDAYLQAVSLYENAKTAGITVTLDWEIRRVLRIYLRRRVTSLWINLSVLRLTGLVARMKTLDLPM